MSGRQRPLALTMGEPAGIGGEVTLKAWLARKTGVRGIPTFFSIDDIDHLKGLADRFGLNVPVVAIQDPGDASDAFMDALPVLHQPLEHPVEPGRPETANAKCVIASIDKAVALVKNGVAGGVVTNPIHKAVLNGEGFAYPGHTEYLAALAGPDIRSVMMLATEELRVVPVTIHVSLRDAVNTLDQAGIIHAGVTTDRDLKRLFGIVRPRIAVAALNPHAGEGGIMGREEIEIIAPAIQALRDLGVAAEGPAPADTLFHADARKNYDAVLCMYHDQALIPLKTIDFAGGVNVTLGLPFVRTSPDHGTAFDIADRGIADPASLIAALRLAGRLATHHRQGLPA